MPAVCDALGLVLLGARRWAEHAEEFLGADRLDQMRIESRADRFVMILGAAVPRYSD